MSCASSHPSRTGTVVVALARLGTLSLLAIGVLLVVTVRWQRTRHGANAPAEVGEDNSPTVDDRLKCDAAAGDEENDGVAAGSEHVQATCTTCANGMNAMCHALRTPLLSAASNVATLLVMTEDTPQASMRPILDTLSASIARLERTLWEMQLLGELNAGGVRLACTPVVLSGVVLAATIESSARAAKMGIEFELVLSPQSKSAWILADAPRLRLVVGACIDNAIGACTPGGAVRVHVGGTPGMWTVTIVDNGRGVSSDDLAELGKGVAFSRVWPGQLGSSGGRAGIGLQLASGLLALHGNGSRLTLTSSGIGHGATCKIILCCPEATPSRLSALNASPLGISRFQSPSGDDACFPSGFRVLHVEDDVILQRSLALRIFERFKIPYECAQDGASGLELVKRDPKRFDVVLLDFRMPIMDGAEAAHKMRSAGYNGLLLGLTGDPPSSRGAFEDAPLDMILDKDSAGISAVISILLAHALPPIEDL